MVLIALGVILITTVVVAAPNASRIDDWSERTPGPLPLGKVWKTYPFHEKPVFKEPPAIVEQDKRRALRLATASEAMRIGRRIKVDLKQSPWLAWEWKPLVLPEGGDVRDKKRNDQVARIMIIFEGMKAVTYVWDTTAPVGTEAQPDAFELFQRAFVVVRSGSSGVGTWHRERRNVDADYRRAFGAAPRLVNFVGFESHSNDTRTRTAVLFGSASWEPR